jgi:hypothetical protein
LQEERQKLQEERQKWQEERKKLVEERRGPGVWGRSSDLVEDSPPKPNTDRYYCTDALV